MKKLFLWVLMAGSSFWAKAQAQVVVTWYYEEWSITQDSLNYKYNTGTNQLQYITDNVANNVSTTDIDNQNPNNYIYDKSGNMVADNSQSMSVSWSPYGKILTNTKAGGANLTFGYNAMQQRVLKRVVVAGDTTRTYYIRDAQGNTMGVYTRHNDSVTWREQYIFGSSRLGLYRADTLVNKGLQVISKLYEGKRNYELTNHLGNVLAVINDRKVDSLSATNVKLGYNAVVISATDYFPFGMAIDSRSYTSSLYRYGFNGKELDKETGEQDYGMRMYDPRIAKFLSLDLISKKYPELSPYQFASNTPIQATDLDGLEAKIAIHGDGLPRYVNEQLHSAGLTTHYTQSDVSSFQNRAERLKVLGFETVLVKNGKEIVQSLVNATKIQNSVGYIVSFTHGSGWGLFLSSDAGFYTSNSKPDPQKSKFPENVAFSSTVKEIKDKIKTGEIKFDNNAIWILLGCNTLNPSSLPQESKDMTLAQTISRDLGIKSIGATGPVYPEVDNRQRETGVLKTEGSFYLVEPIFSVRQVDIKVTKTFLGVNYSTTERRNETYVKDLKITNIGNSIDPTKFIQNK